MPKNKVKLLLIEDRQEDAEMVQWMLGRPHAELEFDVNWATRLQEGLKYLEKDSHDLILTDCQLPDASGLEACETLHQKFPSIPIVVLTGTYEEERMALQAINVGAQDYLMKGTFNPDALVRLIRYTLERHTLKQAADLRKTEFVNTVSHEIRTPLGILREGVALVLDGVAGGISKEQREYLSLSLKSANRLGHIVDNLLDIEKIGAKKVELQPGRFDLVSLAKEIMTDFSVQAQAKGLEMKGNFPEKGVLAVADKEKIIQVLTNLIGNALKFTDKGSIEVAVAENGDSIECSVRDTGRGIAREDIPKVFNRFEQFGRTAGAGEKGTGLGLAICKGIVELHHGKIIVESSPGEGSKFTFSLPNQHEAPRTPSESGEANEGSHGGKKDLGGTDA